MESVTVTADGLYGLPLVFNRIGELRGDLCIVLKKRKMNLFQAAEACAMSDAYRNDFMTPSEQNHGRSEFRSYVVVDPKTGNLKIWKGMFKENQFIPELKHVICENNIRCGKGSQRLLLACMEMNAEVAGALARGHWGAEVNVRHVVDYRFVQDYLTSQDGNIDENIGILLRVYLNLATNFNPDIPDWQTLNRAENCLGTNMQVVLRGIGKNLKVRA